ncbi:MAG: hypothetical protein ACRCSV_01765 [Chlamydiales bacterium]
MYPIRNFNFSTIINFNEQQERRAIIEQAHLLISDESNESRKSIVNILLKTLPEERESLINDALKLVTADTEDEDKEELLIILSNICQEERREIIEETCRLGIEDNDTKSLIFEILSHISQEERKSLIDDVRRLIIDDVSDEVIDLYKPLIVNKLCKIGKEERKTVIDEMILLFKNDKSAQSINRIFNSIIGLPLEARSLLIAQALHVITDTMPASDREILIDFLSLIPVDEIEFLTTQALRLITDTMSSLDRKRIMERLSQVPVNEMDSLTTQVLRLITDSMSSRDIIHLIDFLTTIPLEDMQFLITEALRLITNDMTPQNREDVISYLVSLSENQREFFIMQVLHLSTEDITGENRVRIISSIYDTFDKYKFVTNSNEIIHNPMTVIVSLYDTLQRSYIGLLPSYIEYTNSQGVDDGGLTRSFVAALTESFCNPDYGFVTNSEKGVIPITGVNGSSPLSIRDKEKCFKIIGRFFSSAIQEYKSIVLGQYFHPIVFEMIFNLTAEDLANYHSSSVFNKMLKILIIKELNAPEEFAEAVIQDKITDEIKEIYCIDSKEECIKEYNFDKKIEAILIIAKSMYDSLLNKVEWGPLKGDSVEVLRDKIQGILSRDRVKNALQIDEMDEVDETSFEYIKKWITGTNSEMLEKFIDAISGMKTLNSTTKLNIAGLNGLNKLPQFHTCFFRIDLSQYSSYEAFKEKLEISLDYCMLDSGFQMA